jgi:hypothetical protein
VHEKEELADEGAPDHLGKSRARNFVRFRTIAEYSRDYPCKPSLLFTAEPTSEITTTPAPAPHLTMFQYFLHLQL